MTLLASAPRLDEYFGLLCYEETRLQRLVDQVNQPGWLAQHLAQSASLQTSDRSAAPLALDNAIPQTRYGGFALTEDGIAIVDIAGTLMKQATSFGGSSYIQLRQMLRACVHDTNVRAIMLRIDSPGGITDGCHALAQDIAKAAAQKPVHAFAPDLMASAALWCGVQSSRLTVGATACIGSIGVFMGVVDSSKAANDEGYVVHKITTGGLKGAGMPGTEITNEQIAAWQTRVDDIYEHFISAVQSGRNMARPAVQALATGDCWIGQKAVANGLADAVESFDEAMDAIRSAADAHESPDRRMAAVTTSVEKGTADMKAATYKELKAAFPKASAEFITDQLDAEADIETAKGNWLAHLELQAEEADKKVAEASAKADARVKELEKQLAARKEVGPTGVDADLAETDSAATSADGAIEEWKAKLAALVNGRFKGRRGKAVAHLARSEPALHERYLREYAETTSERMAARSNL